MDASGSAVNAQRKKFRKGKEAKNGEDRISSLPEALLSHILSFLPTRDAIRTSVLSTKWKFTWTSITKLHFDDRYVRYKGKIKMSPFMNFVDRVLLHYCNPTIHDFYLSCGSGCDASRVNSWISAAIWRKVQRLHISCSVVNAIFPHSLFSCDSLVELKLNMSCTLKVFASICLPSLKIFELSYATFSNEIFSKSRQLHFSFPALEVLNVTRCEWLNVKIISIDAPMLKSLKLLSSTFEWELDGSHDCVIKLQVPSLTEFSLRSCGFQEKILLSPFSLSNATIDLSPDVFERNDTREFGLRVCMLLNQISNVKQLALSACTIEALANAGNLPATLPTFGKLNLLRVYSTNFVSRTFMDLLQSLPVLETLIMAWGILHWVEDEFVQEMLPQCFQSSLKVIKFEGFSGNEPVLASFKFFLENVMVLEEMIVIAWKWISKPTKKKLKKHLLTFPKGSNCAKIVCCF